MTNSRPVASPRAADAAHVQYQQGAAHGTGQHGSHGEQPAGDDHHLPGAQVGRDARQRHRQHGSGEVGHRQAPGHGVLQPERCGRHRGNGVLGRAVERRRRSQRNEQGDNRQQQLDAYGVAQERFPPAPALPDKEATPKAPIRNPARANSEAAKEKPGAPEMANPTNTTLPVMFATKTRPKARMLTESTTPVTTVSPQ